MSYSFFVQMPTLVELWRLMEELGYDDLKCCEPEEVEAGLRPDFYFHFYRQGLSTRGVEIGIEKGALQARIMTCAAPDEYETALRFAEAAARLGGSQLIESEEGESFTPDARGTYDEDWVRWMVDSSAESLITIAKEQASRLTLQGPLRTFALGPRTMAALSIVGDRSLSERLIEMMRRVQYPELGFFCASVMSVEKPDGKEMTCTAFGPDCDYFFSRADYLAVIAEPKPLLVRFDDGPELVGDTWVWHDDDHATVAALHDPEWRRLVARARSLAVAEP